MARAYDSKVAYDNSYNPVYRFLKSRYSYYMIRICKLTKFLFFRFEAEISNNSLFVPHQVRPIIGSSTYSQVQQKLQNQPAMPSNLSSVPPPPNPPAFISTFMPHVNEMPEKSYNSEPTPVVLSSAPKLYTNRPTVSMPHTHAEIHSMNPSQQIDISSIQFDVTQKLKKLKAEKSGPNPIAEAAIQAAKASSALQNFQINEKRKKDKKVSE